MATTNKTKLEDILTRQLELESPRFDLEIIDDKLCGSVISASFREQGDFQRQKMMWDALEKELGGQAVQQVGVLLAYTPEEWDVDLEGFHEDD